MLSSQQINTITSRLKQLKLSKLVSEELTDHYACQIEHLMLEGFSFENALSTAFKDFPEASAKQINSSINNLNLLYLMKKSAPILTLVTFIGIIIFTNVKSQEQPWNAPIKGEDLTRVASGFGYRVHPIYKTKKLHKGIDYTAPSGTPVFAVNNGTITKITHSNKGYGNHIEVTHNDSIVTRYAQLKNIHVELNQKVTANQQIGSVGSSGTSTAPHLHFEVIKNGIHINPLKFDKSLIDY